MNSFSGPQVAKLAGVNYPVLDYWAKTGFIAASIQQSSGTGTRRRFSFADVVAVRAVRELRDAGVPLQKLRRMVAFLQTWEGLQNPLAEVRLIVRGDDVLAARGREVVSALRKPGQAMFAYVVDLEPMVKELRQAVAEMAGAA